MSLLRSARLLQHGLLLCKPSAKRCVLLPARARRSQPARQRLAARATASGTASSADGFEERPAIEPTNDTHQDEADLERRRLSNASASTSAAPAPSAAQPTPPDQQTQPGAQQRRIPSLLHVIWAWLLLIPERCRQLLSRVRQKRLQDLNAEALLAKQDPDVVLKYFRELNRQHPDKLIGEYQSGNFTRSDAITAEYLTALVQTGRLRQYAGGADGQSMLDLSREMKGPSQQDLSQAEPGSTPDMPLHVTFKGSLAAAQPSQQRQGVLGQVASWLRGLASSVLTLLCVWAIFSTGASLVRRYAGSPSVAISSGAGSSQHPGSSIGVFSPKEYDKEVLPEKQVRTFRDVKGCDEAKAELEEVVEFLKAPEKFTRLGAKLPKGVLLTGPPGTGKTLLAKAIAGEAGVPFFYKAGSEFEEMFVGVGSRRVRALFATAKKRAPCIVFIDEIDSIGGRRSSGDVQSLRKTLNQLLTEMDGFEASEGVIVVAATNLQETLDPALTRPGRFDRHIAVPMPDIRGRRDILAHYLKDKPVAAEVSADALARQTPGFSGADLANLINEGALLAAKTGAEAIDMRLLDEARDKVTMGVARTITQSEEARRMTAYHEAGHALAALHTPGANKIHKATIVPRGHALGMVQQTIKDEYSRTRQEINAHIDVCMGGKVAEELIFGPDKVSAGVSSDLKSATDSARRMVMELGMSEALGPMALNDRDLGQDTRRRVDSEVRSMLNASYARVKALLTSKKRDLDSLAKALLRHETLTLAEIEQVLAGTFHKRAIGIVEARSSTPAAVSAVPAGDEPQHLPGSAASEAGEHSAT